MIKKRCLAVHRLVGFTLIEVLVSLSILAVALGAGLRAAAVAMDNNAELKERTLARWVGRNQLSRLQAGASFPGTGVTTGDAQQGPYTFAWKIDIETTPNPDFRRVSVSVHRPNSDSSLYQVTGFVVARR